MNQETGGRRKTNLTQIRQFEMSKSKANELIFSLIDESNGNGDDHTNGEVQR